MLLFLITVGLASGAFAQKDQVIVDSIDFLRSSIDENLPHFKVVKTQKDSMSSVVFTNAQKEIQCVKVYVKADSITRYVQWYYSGNHLIYAEQKWINNITNKVVDHEICYMVNDQLVRVVSNDNIMDTSSDKFSRINAMLVSYEQSFLAAHKPDENAEIK